MILTPMCHKSVIGIFTLEPQLLQFALSGIASDCSSEGPHSILILHTILEDSD